MEKKNKPITSQNRKSPESTSKSYQIRDFQYAFLFAIGGLASLLSLLLPHAQRCSLSPYLFGTISAFCFTTVGVALLMVFRESLEPFTLQNPFAFLQEKNQKKESSKEHHSQTYNIKSEKNKLDVTLYSSIDHVPTKDWQALAQKHELFLRRDYLKAIELAPPENVSFRYATFHQDGEVSVIAYFQEFTLYPNAPDKKIPKLFFNLIRPAGFLFGSEKPLRLLLCGNIFLSGSHGYNHNEQLTESECLEAIGSLMKQMDICSWDSKQQYHLLALKDFEPEGLHHQILKQKFGYSLLFGEPMMDLEIRENWKQFDHYLMDMSSKYRQRAKAARKRKKQITQRTLSEKEILRHADRLQELFTNVCKQADFVLAALDIQGLASLKKQNPSLFEFTVYEIEQKIIGFSASFIDQGIFEANYVGIDYEYNRSHRLYQNMLYDFVEEAIAKDCKVLRLGRTATEIKSTVGAEAQEAGFYIRPSCALQNLLARPFLSRIPQKEWQPRHPFSKKSSDSPQKSG